MEICYYDWDFSHIFQFLQITKMFNRTKLVLYTFLTDFIQSQELISQMKTIRLALSKAPKGGRLVVIEVPDGRIKAQLLRLGVTKGQIVRCLERLPGGTVVIQKHQQETALGIILHRVLPGSATPLLFSSISPR
jgi:Fe2+ transport system protein FeoA